MSTATAATATNIANSDTSAAVDNATSNNTDTNTDPRNDDDENNNNTNNNNNSPFGFNISLTDDFNTLSPFGRVLASFVMMTGGREQRKKHASQAALDSLKHVDITTLSQSDRNCSICFEPYTEFKEESASDQAANDKSESLKHSTVKCLDDASTVEMVDYQSAGMNSASEGLSLDDQLYAEIDNPPLLMPLSADAGRVGVYTPSLDPVYKKKLEEKKKKEKKDKLTHCARQLPCGHMFGEACIFEWLKNDVTCPLCRKTVEAADDGNADENGSTTTAGRTMIIYSYPLTRVFINADQSRAGESHASDDPNIAIPEANYDGGSISGNSVIPDEAYSAQEDFLRLFNNGNNDDNGNNNNNSNSNNDNNNNSSDNNNSTNETDLRDGTSETSTGNNMNNNGDNIPDEGNDVTMTSASSDEPLRRSASSNSFRSRRINSLLSSSYNRRSRLMPDRRAVALLARSGRTGGPARRSIIPRTSLLNPYGRGFMVTFSNIRNSVNPFSSNTTSPLTQASEITSTGNASASSNIGNTSAMSEDTANETN